jgi:hypothetical protein
MNGVDKRKKEPITQASCDVAKFLFRKGNSMKVIAQTLGVNPSTVSKIKTAGFDLETYLENRKASNRKTAENKAKAAEAPEVVDYTMAPVPGQIEMDLDAATPEKKPEMSDTTKMMRFFASQVEKLAEALNGIAAELQKMNGGAEA